MADKRLTAKQEGLLQSLLAGKSQREAYKASYNAGNMSDKTIDETVCKLLKQPKIATRYDELRAKALKKAEERGLMTATDVLSGIEAIYEGSKVDDTRTALKALELYGRHLKLFTDRVELAVTEMPVIVLKKSK